MLSKMQLVALASAFLTTEVAALVVNAHRVNHQQLHKKDIAYQATEMVVQTVWETVTVYDDELPTSTVFLKNVAPTTITNSTTSSTSSTLSTLATSTLTISTTPVPTSSSPPAVESVNNQVGVQEVQAAAVTPQSQTPTTSVPAQSSTSVSDSTNNSASGSTTPRGGKRGVAYNVASLVTPFMGSGTKITWAYNWGQTSDGLDTTNLDFVPMLWGPQQIHTSTWQQNADAAIASGAKSLLSFNECDNTGQCNTDAATAAQAHIQLMNPYGSKAAIGSPAITNSNIAGEGVDWLKAWVSACNGQCKFDFCSAHWYSPADPQNLLSHLDDVHEACQGKPVWLTEFAPIDGDANGFLADVMKELDTNPKYDYVQRYSFFFVSLQTPFTSARMMTTATTLSSLGQAYGYS